LLPGPRDQYARSKVAVESDCQSELASVCLYQECRIRKRNRLHLFQTLDYLQSFPAQPHNVLDMQVA